MADKSDTDFERRIGLGYDRLAAAAAAVEAGFIPDTATDPREKQIATLAAENARLLSANGELARQVEALQNAPPSPRLKKLWDEGIAEKDRTITRLVNEVALLRKSLQDEKAPGEPSPAQSNAPTEAASGKDKGKFLANCPKCGALKNYHIFPNMGYTCRHCGHSVKWDDLP